MCTNITDQKKTQNKSKEGKIMGKTPRSFPHGRRRHAIVPPTKCKHMGEPTHAQTKVTARHSRPSGPPTATMLLQRYRTHTNARQTLTEC